MSSLRGYQKHLLDQASAYFRKGYRRVLIQSPTASGKTRLAVSMLDTAAHKGFPSFFIVHRRELIKQTISHFEALNIPHGVIAAGFPPDPAPLIQVASVQTLARQCEQLWRFPRFVVWDEAHHLPARGWAALQAKFGDAHHVGLSGTPIRLDGAGLSNCFEQIVHGPSIRWLQKRKYLAEVRHYAPSNIDLSGVRTKMGDYNRTDLSAAVDRSTIDADAVTAYQRFSKGKRALLFAASVEHAERAAATFANAGVPAEHVDGTTRQQQRDAALVRFERGETLVLTNCDLFGEGLDVPATEAIIMLRATQSRALYLQTIGRGLRPAPGKGHAVVLDLVGNYSRHGLVEEDRQWTLDAPARKQTQRTDLMVCGACDGVTAHRAFCAICGAPPKPHRAADVAVWQRLISEPGLASRLRGMSYGSVERWANTTERAHIAAIARGFKPGWVCHRIRELNGEAA